MSRDKVLPSKLTIMEVQSALDTGMFDTEESYHRMCSYVNEGDIPLYVNNNLFDIYAIDDMGEDNGLLTTIDGAVPQSFASSEYMIKALEYVKPPSIFDKEYDPEARVHRFKVEEVSNNGVRYYITEVGERTRGVLIDTNLIYGKRDEILNYREINLRMGTVRNGATNKVTQSKAFKSEPIQEQRIKQFTTVLAAKAETAIVTNDDYQKCYIVIGEPTKSETWKILQQVNPELFATGKDDFFKALKALKIINFKMGTGSNR